eukprot:TRINITY_DN42445_c0_g1_i1.p1 TRINITY_DN42445_c0_g1~~TRINITY_DN42445_c0_g1_i1.p1  ORF type:complete len:370 (-),score=28.12 TRINITY_DN42445_c0_g1_i1:101-1210(-)
METQPSEAENLLNNPSEPQFAKPQLSKVELSPSVVNHLSHFSLSPSPDVVPPPVYHPSTRAAQLDHHMLCSFFSQRRAVEDRQHKWAEEDLLRKEPETWPNSPTAVTLKRYYARGFPHDRNNKSGGMWHTMKGANTSREWASTSANAMMEPFEVPGYTWSTSDASERRRRISVDVSSEVSYIPSQGRGSNRPSSRSSGSRCSRSTGRPSSVTGQNAQVLRLGSPAQELGRQTPSETSQNSDPRHYHWGRSSTPSSCLSARSPVPPGRPASSQGSFARRPFGSPTKSPPHSSRGGSRGSSQVSRESQLLIKSKQDSLAQANLAELEFRLMQAQDIADKIEAVRCLPEGRKDLRPTYAPGKRAPQRRPARD